MGLLEQSELAVKMLMESVGKTYTPKPPAASRPTPFKKKESFLSASSYESYESSESSSVDSGDNDWKNHIKPKITKKVDKSSQNRDTAKETKYLDGVFDLAEANPQEEEEVTTKKPNQDQPKEKSLISDSED